MTNSILLNIQSPALDESYIYILIIILLLIICFLLYRVHKLTKRIQKADQSYRFSFEILDNLPYPIIVKDIQNNLQYYYWNKESAIQSGIRSEDAIGLTDYEIYGEERGGKYRSIDKALVEEGKTYRGEEQYVTPDGMVHETITVKSITSWKGEKKWLIATRWDITQLKTTKES